jgi:DNA-binding transcriptional ArsR family regulator
MAMKGTLMPNEVNLPADDVLEEVAECLKVMAHPVRLKMVNILTQGEFAVHEIAQLCATSPSQACEHLRLLKGHGLLSSERRGRTVYYQILSPRLPRLMRCIGENCGS